MKRAQLRRFFYVLHALTVATQLVVGLAVASLARRAWPTLGAAELAALALGTALALWAPLPGRMALARHDRHVSRLRVLLTGELYFVIWCTGLGAAALYPALLLASAAAGLASGGAVPVLDLAVPGVAVPLLVSAWGVLVRPRFVRVREVVVPIQGLPAALDGYRIAHLSDLHIGAYCPKERGLGWARRTNALAVDLVALTGDYVTAGDAFHDDIAAVLGAFRGKDGVVASMGNHDYFGDGEPLVEKLRARGVTVLRNEHVVVRRGEAELCVVGIDDLWTRRARPGPAMEARPKGLRTVVLAHDPLLFEALAELGADLVLSGHTHWGQIGVPFLAHRLSMGRVAHRYNAARYGRGRATLWVHPGLGATGVPIRVGVAPEITVLALRCAADPPRR